ncbi:uncharacterized protein LOC128965883 [Oppia nitens]|uniref:uncharacterized protein LOC128965883 n=1 Tax=Oppia nitens TaxID=1686743 RepID=UPI0023DA6F01|nr:uncharacterized protein LOC128965883 [Oppia nitens]
MTTEDFSATLIDETCLGDIFTLQSQFLDDFEFGLDANHNHIDSLIEFFDDNHMNHKNYLAFNKMNNNYKSNNMCIKSDVSVSSDGNSVVIISPKVKKSKTRGTSLLSPKSKGISLLAKPKKSSKRSLLNINDRQFDPLFSYLLHEHDYCLIKSIKNNNYYNKSSNYLTQLSETRLTDKENDSQRRLN